MNTELRAEAVPKLFHTGSLAYTKAGLFVLFSWLLWGDFSFTLMEIVWASVLPLDLHKLEAPNTIISLFIVTIPQAMNFVMNPIISTVSDRYRSRFGRRIPFLFFATPFVTLFLILLSFTHQIGAFLHAWINVSGPERISASSLTIGIICVFIIGFRFFELFINTIYWYLFNDVVPAALLGRFLGLFRVVGTMAGVLFNYFIYGYAQSHGSWILMGAGLLYGSVFMLMCLNVKEGSYPPPDSMAKGSRSPWVYLKTFGEECFSHRIFTLTYLSFAFFSLVACIAPFNIFMATSLGLTLDQVGKVAAGAGIVTGILIYPAGVLVDRFHPIRMMLVAVVGLCIISPFNLIFLFFDLTPDMLFTIYIGIAMITAPLGAIAAAASIPLLMRVLPHDRYGQFCAANAMVAALTAIIGGALAGLFLDLMKTFFHRPDFYYRCIPIWTTGAFLLALIPMWMLFREWKKLGGDVHYRPPCSDKFKEFYEA
jgi:maltose/moltooligosaccharide transporter